MSLLVFGKTGQLATELARRAPEAVYLGREAADLSDPDACAVAVRDRSPEAVIIAAAWTAVDAAEENADVAQAVNADAPAAIARACAEVNAALVHVSTDYVFDGSGTRPWAPGDAEAPLGVYGKTKLAGERAVLASGARAAIFRTSWVFSAHGGNFVKTMLRLSETRERLSIVADQVGGPTWAGDLAEICLAAATRLGKAPDAAGVYHFAGAPDVSWADFAREIFAEAGREVEVEDIPSAAYPTPAPRPLNSRMDCAAAVAAFGVARPDWRTGLRAVLQELEGRVT